MEDLIVYIALTASVLIGGAAVAFMNPTGERSLKLMLAFSGAFLLGVSFLHLIPEVYEHGPANIGVYVLIGFVFQLLLEFFSEGIEHGHVHIHPEAGVKGKFPIVIMLSLCIHAFVEGIPLEREIHSHYHDAANSFHGHHHGDHSLLMGVVFHNIPVSIALMTMFLKSGLSNTKAFLYLGIFAIMGPLGTFTGHHFGESISGNLEHFFEIVLAVVVGMFMHISTTILFESSENHWFNLYKFIAIISGVLVAMVNF
ncbi:MAG TPA: zinc/iron permease [Flavobacteriales bacterium]|nr:zinc/iron permease [Flavobacteriales bacterium]